MRRRGFARTARAGEPAVRLGEAVAREPAAPPPQPAASAVDPAVARAREAGGPVDRAAYACACGYLFDASVSTTVTCPHCGADQAW